MDRTVDFLLKKYETKQPGEEWKLETEVKYIQEYRDKQKIRLLDTLITQNFRIPLNQKRRVQYLIKDLDFQDMGGWTNECSPRSKAEINNHGRRFTAFGASFQ